MAQRIFAATLAGAILATVACAVVAAAYVIVVGLTAAAQWAAQWAGLDATLWFLVAIVAFSVGSVSFWRTGGTWPWSKP